ncbi:MAG TPA: chorismate synthase, partial [Chitinophagales bacterium]|nr:chorismate synthase [Chitinophagales bacterium]
LIFLTNTCTLEKYTMPGNTLGRLLRLTTFGESHGPAIGGVLDGVPSKIKFNLHGIQHQLDRRRPGQSGITTQRDEKDRIEILSGLFNGESTGAPIAFIIRNSDAKSGDYHALKHVYRPSHADFTYQQKYGIRDHRGGGRSSARATAALVGAGAFAEQVLEALAQKENIAVPSIVAFVSSVGPIHVSPNERSWTREQIDENAVRCPNSETALKMNEAIEEAKRLGDSLGGIVTCSIADAPIGLGEPVFDKLQADLAKAMLSINAVHGFEYGMGFGGSERRGSETNDAFEITEDRITTKTNHSGGIQGGISNGMEIYFRVAFKPTATISASQQTVDTDNNPTTLEATGRHDPCVVPRAVPIVEAATALVLADHWLRNCRNR